MHSILQMLKWLLFIMLPKLPRSLPDDPARHSDYDIGWSLRDGWRALVERHIRENEEDMPSAQARFLKRIGLNVAFVQRMADDEAVAFVRPSVGIERLPDVALGLLLGSSEDMARRVELIVRRESEDLISSGRLLIGCRFADGFWMPFDARSNYWGIESQTNDGIRTAVRMKMQLIQRQMERGVREPARVEEDEIAQGLARKWEDIVESHADLFDGYWSHESLEAFRAVRIEVVTVDMIAADDRMAALVRTNVKIDDLPDLALALLLGTRSDMARDIERNRRRLLRTDIPEDQVLVYCHRVDGEWDFARVEGEEEETEPRLAIGESAQVRGDHKEAPFAVAALGPAEIVNDTTVRVPARITATTPRLVFEDMPLASLHPSSRADEDDAYWALSDSDHDNFGGVILVKGGTRDGFIYFGPDEYSTAGPARGRRFDEIQILDGTEITVHLNLTRSAPVPDRITFENGTPNTIWDDSPVPGILYRERSIGREWENLKVPRSGIGDTVEVMALGDPVAEQSEPWFELTVLEAAEAFGGGVVRVRLRIANRSEDDLRCEILPLDLSSGPDRYGRLDAIWEMELGSAADRPDSFENVSLAHGETHEAFAYFRAPDAKDSVSSESPAILWYGERLFEFPILLA